MPKEITQEELEALKGINKGIIKKYNKLQAFFQENEQEKTMKSLPLLVAESYKESMEAAAQKILNDELYDGRQKAILIERAAKEEHEKRMLEIDELVQAYKADTEALKEEVEEDLELTRRIYAKRDKADLEYYTDAIAKLKTDVFMAGDPKSIEAIANDLLKRAAKEPTLAKVLTLNGYLFAEQAKAVTSDPTELSRLRAKLSGVLNEAKELVYRPEEKALMKMRENLSGAVYDSTGGRNIVSQLTDSYINKAESLKSQHEQERFNEIRREAEKMVNNY